MESKCDHGLNTLGKHLDKMTSDGAKAQHAMIDAARLADEPKAAMKLEKDKKQKLSATYDMKLVEDDPDHQTLLLPEVAE